MSKDRISQLRTLFFLGLLGFNFPLIWVFSTPTTLAGIPVLYWYILLVWLLVIYLTARIVERPAKGFEEERPG